MSKTNDILAVAIPVIFWGGLITLAVVNCGCNSKEDPEDNPRTWKDGMWHYKDSAYIFKIELDTVYYDPEEYEEDYDPRH